MTHKLHISTEHLLSLLKQMLRIRRFEEKCAELYSLQKIRGFLHLYVGEEAVAVGAMSALKPEDSLSPFVASILIFCLSRVPFVLSTNHDSAGADTNVQPRNIIRQNELRVRQTKSKLHPQTGGGRARSRDRQMRRAGQA